MIFATRLMKAASIVAWVAVPATASCATAEHIEHIVKRHVRQLLPTNDAGGISVAVRVAGRTYFLNYGYADAARKRPMTSDAVFNLASVSKIFDATLLALSVQRGELAFDDPVAKHVVELQGGQDIRRVTLKHLASFTSGIVLPQDRPPWPTETFTQAGYLATLNAWVARQHQPGKQVIHVSSGFILLRLALERRLGLPLGNLMEQRIFKTLQLSSTTLPVPAANRMADPRGELPPALLERAVQGYEEDGTPSGAPGELQGYYHWLGTGQVFSSARDMAEVISANLGELPEHRELQEAMKLTQKGILHFDKRSVGAMAWERHKDGRLEIVERYGGLHNASVTVAMIPARKLGIVLLCNRGGQHVATAVKAILKELASL